MQAISGKSFPGVSHCTRTPGVILLVKYVKAVLAQLAALTK